MLCVLISSQSQTIVLRSAQPGLQFWYSIISPFDSTNMLKLDLFVIISWTVSHDGLDFPVRIPLATAPCLTGLGYICNFRSDLAIKSSETTNILSPFSALYALGFSVQGSLDQIRVIICICGAKPCRRNERFISDQFPHNIMIIFKNWNIPYTVIVKSRTRRIIRISTPTGADSNDKENRNTDNTDSEKQ